MALVFPAELEAIPLHFYRISQEVRESVHSLLDIRSPIRTPPPPYSLKPETPASFYSKKIIYAEIHPILPQVVVSSDAIELPCNSPVSLKGSLSSSPSSETRSPTSFLRPPSLRRSKRLPEGRNLRELRVRESEADLKRVYETAVESYLNGEIFDNFKCWPMSTISEDA